MKIFESFNFDIIIILILISSIITGLYFNLYRQGRRTLVIILPIIILYFSYNLIYDSLRSITVISNFILSLIEKLKFKNIDSTYAVVIYFFSYIFLGIAIRLIYSLFRVKVQKRVLSKATVSSKLLGAMFGILNGYVLGMLIMFILNPIIGLNYQKPITKVYIETTNDVLTFSSLNRLKNVNIKKYENTKSLLDEVTGRVALNNYEEILEVFDAFSNLEAELTNDVIPVLTSDSALLLDNEDLLNSLFLNKDKIYEFEKANEKIVRIKEIINFLTINKALLKVYNENTDYSYYQVSQYMINNQEDLLLELNKNLYKDNLLNQVNSFKYYSESRETYFELIDYTSVDIYTDVIYFENKIASDTEAFIEAYKAKIASNEEFTNTELIEVFDKYLKYKDLISNINSKASLSLKLTLVDKFNYYFFNPIFLNNKLLKSYIVDSITNEEANSYELYSEYIFYAKLANGINLEELSKDEFIIILNNLDKLVADSILSKDEAVSYFTSLFRNDFYGLLNSDLIEEIKNIESEYLNEELIALLD